MKEPEAEARLGTGARPLAGLTVAEIGGEIATRYCGRLLAVLGASVVRAPGGEGGGAAPDPLFAAWLDEGKTIVATAGEALDVLAEGPPAGRLVIAGQTREAVAGVEARLATLAEPPALLAITWFDPRGPYAPWRANDPIMQAMSGVAFPFGPIEGPPVLSQGYAPQMVGGLTGFIAALAALIPAQPTVRRIETNIFEAALCFMETGSVAAAALGLESHRLGVNRFVPTCPSGVFRSRDGFIGVTALTPAQWRSLAELIGRPDMGRDPRYASSIERLMAADELDAVLIPTFLEHPTDWWVAEGDKRRIPITPAPPPRELPDLPHWRERGSFAPVASSRAEGPTLPYRFVFEGERSGRPSGGAAGPLAGIRVADFSMGWAGPLGARLLADLGADVLKVESTGKPDWWRGWEVVPDADPPPTELPRNFMAVNRNKRGLDLDLASPSGLAAAEAIIARSDVVIDNQGPGVMDKLGLGPEEQRRLNPRTVSLSMPPFGRTGPLAGLRAYGSTVEQASGMPFVNGHDDWDPCQQHVAYGDPVAGLYAAAAALVGLYARERLGGAEIDLCQVE
ncbi:MAG: CoA transferase, partial [Caulobacterales bacterium]